MNVIVVLVFETGIGVLAYTNWSLEQQDYDTATEDAF